MGAVVVASGLAAGAMGGVVAHEVYKQPQPTTVSEEVTRDITIGSGVVGGAAGAAISVLGGVLLSGLEIGRRRE